MKSIRCSNYEVELTEDEVRELRDNANSRDLPSSEEEVYNAWKDERSLQRFDCQEGVSVKEQYKRFGAWLSRVSRNK